LTLSALSGGFVQPRDLLFHGGEETLWVEEPTQPVGIGTGALHPFVQLFVSFDEIVEPFGESWDDPSDLSACGIIYPLVGDLGVEDGVDGFQDIGCHDDLTVDGVADIDESLSDDGDNLLHTLNLLVEEDIQWHCQTSRS
jgi:hypothetical protein